jgi:hypothetical protein
MCQDMRQKDLRNDVAIQLLEVVEHLERDAKVTAACGMQVTTKLLRMVRLDLLCQIHGISERELEAIGDELNSRQPMSDGTAIDGPGFKLPH